RDVATLRELADYAALTIEAIEAIEELGEREHHAALLNRINSRIRATLELPQILDTAVRELGTALGTSRCFVRLRRGAELMPPSVWCSAAGTARLAGDAPPGPLLETSFRERRTVVTREAREFPAVAQAMPLLPGALAVLATPITLRNEAVGVLAFHQL